MPADISAEWLANESITALWPWIAVADSFSPLDGLFTTLELTADLLSTCNHSRSTWSFAMVRN